MAKIDEKDCRILNCLQKNCRAPLTAIAKEVNLSVDSTRKRVQKLLRNKIFHPQIQVRPRQLGFDNIVDVKIRLRNYNEKKLGEFIEYLKEKPRVAEIFMTSGGANFSIVLVARNTEELAGLTNEIRGRFDHIIASWSEHLTTKVYKFEKYNVLRLMGYE